MGNSKVKHLRFSAIAFCVTLDQTLYVFGTPGVDDFVVINGCQIHHSFFTSPERYQLLLIASLGLT